MKQNYLATLRQQFLVTHKDVPPKRAKNSWSKIFVEFWLRISVIRLLDYFFNIWPLTTQQ